MALEAVTLASACSLDRNGLASPLDASQPDTLSDDSAPPDVTSEDAGMDSPPDVPIQPLDGSDATPEDADAAACPSTCTSVGGTCEPTVDGGVQCSFYCNTSNPCVSVACPAGMPCYVDCQGANACSAGVDCSQSSSCSIICGGSSNCGQLSCAGTDCKIQCQVQSSCTGSITCEATNSCTILCQAPGTCTGAIQSGAQNTTVSCLAMGTCTQNISCSGTACAVSCLDGGSCSGGECCDASTCAPRTTQVCP